MKNIDGLLCLLTDNIDKSLIDKTSNLKVISNMAVGFDNIDIESATNRKIMVTNTPEILTETTADLTFALLMSTARRLSESENYLRNGKWKTWSPMLLAGQDIHGANLGIIGLGRIGEALSKRAKGFNMNIYYYSRTRKKEKEKELGINYLDLNSVLKKSDFICILIPYNYDTHHFIGKEELTKMKPSAIIINTSRGEIIDEHALYSALKNNHIQAAGLDVFEKEPVSLNNPLLSLKNVTALPHIGSASKNTRINMSIVAAENLIQGLNGETPDFLVNKTIF